MKKQYFSQVRYLFQIIVLTTLLASCTVNKGRVIGITDGDTFTMIGENNEQVKVRLYGVDCPERNQAYGQVAKQYTADMIFGKQVDVEIQDKDRYGRIIGIVHTKDGKILNEELLKAGLAWHYTYYDNSSKWADMEATARKNKTGLWQAKRPIAPWRYRSNKRNRN